MEETGLGVAGSGGAAGSASAPETLSRSETGMLAKEITLADTVCKMYIQDHTVNPGLDTHDLTTVHLQRGVVETTNAMKHLGISPKVAIVYVNSKNGSNGGYNATMQLVTVPCSTHGTFAHDVTSDAYVLSMPRATSREGASVLAITLTGIQHDAVSEYPAGLCKKIALQHVHSPIHTKFGVHDMNAIELTMQHLLKSAHWIGEIHLMSQIAKTILKARLHKSSDVAKLTVEQKGIHLKDEIKLCAYWNALQAELTQTERRCLDNAVHRMHDTRPLTYVCKDGNVYSACTPVVNDVQGKRPLTNVQSAHSVHAVVCIKGAMNFPSRSLNCDKLSLNVRIDNDWTFECHALVYN